MKRILILVADAAVGFAVLALAPFAWLMRDGLGPDAVESSGVAAIGRWFWTFSTGPILIGLGVAAVALHMSGNREK
jgi:hypothetical protein